MRSSHMKDRNQGNGRRLDIGVSLYRSLEKLKTTLDCIRENSVTDWHLMIHVNWQAGDSPGINPPTEEDRKIEAEIRQIVEEDQRITCLNIGPDGRIGSGYLNSGYAWSVNFLMLHCITEYFAYFDHDAYVRTKGWDEIMCGYLDRFHEVGIVFPNGGAYPVKRDAYTEVLWAPGFCFLLTNSIRGRMDSNGPEWRGLDTDLGHQEDPDLCMRLRMAGFRCVAATEVNVTHDATATLDPDLANQKRIADGVVRFVDKWTKYFGGANLNYHSPNVLRWEDWPPNALYLEAYWKQKLPGLNDAPERVEVDGRKYDLIKVPRLAGFYTGRVI